MREAAAAARVAVRDAEEVVAGFAEEDKEEEDVEDAVSLHSPTPSSSSSFSP